MSCLLKACRLTYATPNGRTLQADLTFELQSGQMLLITGSNGCGKSTLLKALLGQFPIAAGSIDFRAPRSRVEYIPQLENTEVHFPLTLGDVLTISRRRKLDRVSVEQFGLLKESQLGTAWNTASGGERRRTMLTRALLKNPSVLVFDEPMNHLDSESRRAMVDVMAQFLRQGPSDARAIVMVCHQGLSPEEKERFELVHLDLDKGSRDTSRVARWESVSRLTREPWGDEGDNEGISRDESPDRKELTQ